MQEERQRGVKSKIRPGGGKQGAGGKGPGSRDTGVEVVGSSVSVNHEMPVERILDAEMATDPRVNVLQLADDNRDNPMPTICESADRQLFYVVDWAKRIPHFTSLPLQDQLILLRAGMFLSYTVKSGVMNS